MNTEQPDDRVPGPGTEEPTGPPVPGDAERTPEKSRFDRLRDRRARWFRGGVSDEAVLAQLREMEKPKGSRLNGLLLLGISVFLFVSLGGPDKPLPSIVILVGVIAVHELGHYIGMRLSGYRNVRMFFIPMFGAAVSGENPAAPGYKKAIVSLLGPGPGILIGAVILAFFAGSPSRLPSQAGMTFLVLNLFNLLPLYPLDGGRFLEEVLLCRSRYIGAVFKVLTGALIVLIGIGLESAGLAVVGGIVVLTVAHSFKVAGVARRIREELGQPSQSSPLDLPPEDIGRLVAAVRRAFPSFGKAKVIAGLVRNVWESLHARPPGVAGTMVLLLVYVATFAAPLALMTLSDHVVLPARPERAAAEEVDYGVVDGSVYRNEYFGMVVTAPPGWCILTKRSAEAIADAGRRVIAGKDEGARSRAEAWKHNTVQLLALYRYPLGTPVRYNSNIMCSAERVRHVPEIRRGRDLLRHLRALAESSGLHPVFPGEPYSAMVGGIEFDVLEAELQMPEMVVRQKWYVTIVKGYALGMFLSYASEEERSALEAILASTTFERR